MPKLTVWKHREKIGPSTAQGGSFRRNQARLHLDLGPPASGTVERINPCKLTAVGSLCAQRMAADLVSSLVFMILPIVCFLLSAQLPTGAADISTGRLWAPGKGPDGSSASRGSISRPVP